MLFRPNRPWRRYCADPSKTAVPEGHSQWLCSQSHGRNLKYISHRRTELDLRIKHASENLAQHLASLPPSIKVDLILLEPEWSTQMSHVVGHFIRDNAVVRLGAVRPQIYCAADVDVCDGSVLTPLFSYFAFARFHLLGLISKNRQPSMVTIL
jgi:hypothetical protein